MRSIPSLLQTGKLFHFAWFWSWNQFRAGNPKAILEIRIKGLGSEHRTAIFPKLIFTLKRGLNLEPGTPNYDIKQLALECATKRMYPDVLSYDKIVELTGSFKVPMGVALSFKVGRTRMVWSQFWPDEPRGCDGQFTSDCLESGGDKEILANLLMNGWTSLKMPWFTGWNAPKKRHQPMHRFSTSMALSENAWANMTR